MIISSFFEAATRPRNAVSSPTWTRPELLNGYGIATASGQTVSPERSKQVHAAYRCANLLSNDIAKIPLQQFTSRGPGDVQRVRADGRLRNMAYVVEVMPNAVQTPFILRKTAMMWLLFWGNAYFWMPPKRERELFLLPSSSTLPYNKPDGSLWYKCSLPDGEPVDAPAVEVMHLMINSVDGLLGRSVIHYARETLGRRLGASETQNKFYKQGLLPGAIAWVRGELNPEARKKIRDKYAEALEGSENSGRLAVIDQKIEKLDIVQMQPRDAQFLESINATDAEIANFFEVPLYKLNLGKQSYQSNEQQNLDYLSSTLDPYLVQIEQAAMLKWLTLDEQAYSYWRFERNAFLRTDAKTRTTYLKDRIQSGQMTPNEARQIEDLPAYADGDRFYMPSNIQAIQKNSGTQMTT